MTDWNKLKVTDLKEELKSRGVPLTGLKLKQQLVDKLTELDAGGDEEAGVEEPTPEAAHPKKDESLQAQVAEPEAKPEEFAGVGLMEKEDPTKQVPKHDQEHTGQANGSQENDSKEAPGEELAMLEERGVSPAEQAKEENSTSDDSKLLEPVAESQQDTAAATISDETPQKQPVPVGATSTPTTDAKETPSAPSTPVLIAEMLEDSRKRKRRSVTPAPSTVDVALKKARARDGTPMTTKREVSALEAVQQATEDAEDIVMAEDIRTPTPEPAPTAEHILKRSPSPKPYSPSRTPSKSYPPEQNGRPVASAKHPATSALYLRNFKRPLHIPTLRSYITNTAKSAETAEDPVKFFHLDGIRTHAFVSFTSISAATRVRSEMHDLPFPNEPNREPLFVDFVPEEKLEEWIGTENRGGRYQVTYEESSSGIQAIHQEIGFGRAQPPASRPTPTSTKPSLRGEAAAPGPAPAGIHPDRAALVPQDSNSSRPLSPPSKPSASGSAGTGFKALDDLFSSTTAKPKLYYKAVSKPIAEERLERIKDLRGYANMGKSGDEGMKRYTFELERGREEWVDKGPEFGYGKRGTERLIGFRGRGGGGGGGYRGGGGGRFGGGDSWRGR